MNLTIPVPESWVWEPGYIPLIFVSVNSKFNPCLCSCGLCAIDRSPLGRIHPPGHCSVRLGSVCYLATSHDFTHDCVYMSMLLS